MRLRYLSVVLILGCSSGDPPLAPSPIVCAATEVAADEVCVTPGVDVCSEGFVSDGNAGCKAVLPEAPCTGSTIATPGDTACRPVGIETCAEGFVADETRQCVALANDECESGERALLGTKDCKPISDCGVGKWGPLPIEPGSIFVDSTYLVGDGDGSADHPFADLPAAIALAGDARNLLVLAEGIYEFGAALDKPLEIRGRCVSRVVIAPPKSDMTSASITTRADVTLRSLTVQGFARGLVIASGTTRVLSGQVRQTGAEGIVVEKGGALVLEDSVVTQATSVGVLVSGTATITGSTIAQTLAIGTDGGIGLELRDKSTASAVASIVERNERFGIVIDGSTLTLDRTLLRANQVVGGGLGAALFAHGGSTVAITRSSLEGNASIGLYTSDGTLSLENSLISDTSAISGVEPTGLWAATDPFTKKPATVTLKHSAIVGNQGSGLFIVGANVTIDHSLVRDIGESKKDQSGDGIVTLHSPIGEHPTELTVGDSLIERTHAAGVTVTDGKATIERSVIRDILPSLSGRNGEGIAVYAGSESTRAALALRSSMVERVYDVGAFAFGSDLVIESSLFRDIRQRKGGLFGHGIYLSPDSTNGQNAHGEISGSVIAGAFEVGINVFQSSAVVDRTTVSGVRSGTSTGFFGDGVSVAGGQFDATWLPASVTIRRSRIDGAARAGLSVFAAQASLERVRFSCTAVPLDVESLVGIAHPPELEDRGGNGCGCGALERCVASSSNLSAIARY